MVGIKNDNTFDTNVEAHTEDVRYTVTTKQQVTANKHVMAVVNDSLLSKVTKIVMIGAYLDLPAKAAHTLVTMIEENENG